MPHIPDVLVEYDTIHDLLARDECEERLDRACVLADGSIGTVPQIPGTVLDVVLHIAS